MAFLDDIKERLGFGNEEEAEFDEELYGADFDEYAETFDDYADEDGAEDAYSAFAPVSTRSGRTERRSRASRKASGRASYPKLVSIDDVRNSTRIPESLNRDPLPPRRGESYGRDSVGHAADFARSGSEIDETPKTTAGQENAPVRSVGMNALFESTSGTQTKGMPGSEVGISTHPAAPSSDYDPYRAYEAGGASRHRPTRNISIISPQAYGEVENVARMLRAGDAVVLSLRTTPSQLSKRILDFSFGVASALDATVDCIADKVFAITRISNLTEDELARLRTQGVI